MTDYTHNADWKVLVSALMTRYQFTQEQAQEVLYELRDVSPTIKRDIMQAIIHSKSQRELEQVMYSFQMPISLAVLTHYTRHRMHSLLVPPFTSINFENIIVPDTIQAGHEAEYRELFANNMLLMEEFKREGVRSEDLICFLQCGHAVNITTTMNARALEWISRMRCCTKAQLEPRRLANQMTELVSQVSPLIGEGLGPTCKVFGYCNEGKDSCKNRGVVVKAKKKDN